MKFLDYINSQRRGKNANLLEREAMRDPFLSDAIDGFDSVKGDHIKNISELKQRIGKQHSSSKKSISAWRFVAASIALLFALGGYLLFQSDKTTLRAQIVMPANPLEIVVPEQYYADNASIIEQQNIELTKVYKPTFENFKVNEVLNATISKEELELLSKEAQDGKGTIEIYTPDNESYLNETDTSQPYPIGGWSRFDIYMKNSFIPPADDACKDMHGKVAVDFLVDENGKPYDFEIAYSLCGMSENEVVRLIKAGPKWKAGTNSNRARVKFEF